MTIFQNKDLYICGGSNSPSCEVCHIVPGICVPIADMPHNNGIHASVVLNNCLYVIGGDYGDGTSVMVR